MKILEYIDCVMLIIVIIFLLTIYFTVPGSGNSIDLKAVEENIELMNRLTTALQSIMDDIDNSLEWNRKAKQEPPMWWALEEE